MLHRSLARPVAVMSLLATASAFAGTPTNAVLNVGTTQEPDTLNPIVYTTSAASYLLGYSFRSRAVFLTEKGTYEPVAMESIPTLENKGVELFTEDGKDKMRVTWTLKKEAVWGDGKDISAADYEFAFKVCKNENVSIPNREPCEVVEKIALDPKNPKKFTLTYSKRKWDYYRLLPFPLPKHVEEPIFNNFATVKEGYEKNSLYVKDPTQKALWSGPYVVSEYKQGAYVKFAKNEKWWGAQKPKINSVVVKLIANSGTLEPNLLSGEVDMLNQQGFTFDQAAQFDKKVEAEKLSYKVNFTPGLVYEHIDVNLDVPGLNDKSVRKAMALAMDTSRITKSLFENRQSAAIHWLTPIDSWFTDDKSVVTRYPNNNREAERLLDAAGWKKAADGIRAKDGKRLSFSFSTTAGNKTRENVQAMLQEQWKQIGVEVVIKNEPAKNFFGETTKKRKFDLALFAWISSPESSPRPTFHSSQIPSEANGWDGQNYMGWKNSSVDEAADKIEKEFDPSARKKLASSIIKAYTDELPVLPLYYRANIVVAPKNLEGLVVPAGQDAESYRCEFWNLK